MSVAACRSLAPLATNVFWSRVRLPRDSDCWVWEGSFGKGGYGVHHGAAFKARAHRIAYEATIEPVPNGLELDHLCRNRSCVNPAHLEPVTHRENVLRSHRAGGRSDVGLTKLIATARARGLRPDCKRGHSLSGPNLRVCKNGMRHCRSCDRLRFAKAVAK